MHLKHVNTPYCVTTYQHIIMRYPTKHIDSKTSLYYTQHTTVTHNELEHV